MHSYLCKLMRCLSNAQVLNGAIAAALFNLLYDVVLSQKVKWYAMCPVVDFLNHKSTVQVRQQPLFLCALRPVS